MRYALATIVLWLLVLFAAFCSCVLVVSPPSIEPGPVAFQMGQVAGWLLFIGPGVWAAWRLKHRPPPPERPHGNVVRIGASAHPMQSGDSAQPCDADLRLPPR